MRRTRRDYGRFYEHYQPFVASYAIRRVHDSAVDDVVAEVFLIAWRRDVLANDAMPDDALPWLYRTARNVIGNRYRSDQRLAALREKLLSVPGEAPADPAATVANRTMVADALAVLSESDRELILLAAWEGLTAREIGEVLDLRPGAVSVRLHRARKKVADRAPSAGAFSRELTTAPIEEES